MQRRALVLSLLLPLALELAACGDDVSEADSISGGDTDSGTSGGMTSLTVGSMSDSADSSGSNSNSNSATETESDSITATGSDDSGDATLTADTTASATDTDSASATQGDTTGDEDPTGDDGTDDTGGGPGDPPPDPPGVEDGFCMDPGAEQWCYTGAPTTYNVGECKPGLQECIQIDLDLGQWGPCEDEQLPEVETCDGLDNDCDGEVDEDQGSSMCGQGLCQHEEPNCIDGEDNECDPFDGEMMETCNGIDDDCDGQIDDGLGDDTVECGLGQCEHSVTFCEDGEMPECDPLQGATDEVCDGVDNDCDGDVDEGLPDLHCGVGQCEHDVPSCINGIPQVCDPFDGATDEVCDGIDNDCDGLIDEDQGNWVCGDFECEVTVPKCIDGVEQPPESCVPEPGGDEICGDGIDNNCDGIDSECAESFLVGTDNEIRPIDIIWAVDSSGSMSEEMATVEAEINDFADTLAASGSSTRLHLISDRGGGAFEICVSPPLGGAACADNAPGFYQYDTNIGVSMVHSNNALGRIMQQSPVWTPRLQANSHVSFVVTTDDNGDDIGYTFGAGDLGATGSHAECEGTSGNVNSYIVDGTTNDRCRWDDPTSATNYTSLAYDNGTWRGFTTFMTNFFPNHEVIADWTFYSIIGGTGTTILNGANNAYEFSCATRAANGLTYVQLSLLTETHDSMTQICAADWDLSGLASDIVNNIPNDTYVLDGSPPGTCLNVNPATIQVVVNGIPMPAADWSYSAATCTVTIENNIPVVGDNVVIIYEIF